MSKVKNSKAYLAIVFSFGVGVISSALLQRLCGIRTIWFATLIIVFINAFYFYQVKEIYKRQNY